MGQQGEVEGESPVMVTGSGGTSGWFHQIDPAEIQPQTEPGLDLKLPGEKPFRWSSSSTRAQPPAWHDGAHLPCPC